MPLWPEAQPRWEPDINGGSLLHLFPAQSAHRAFIWLLAMFLATALASAVTAKDAVGFSATGEIGASSNQAARSNLGEQATGSLLLKNGWPKTGFVRM